MTAPLRERLEALLRMHDSRSQMMPHSIAAATLTEALAALAEREKDAERYRWLRNKSAEHRVSAPSATMQDGHGVKVIWQSYGMDDRVKPRCVLFAEALDAAIDAAIKEKK